MKKTEEQINVHSAMKEKTSNLLIEAVAGSGKTTTIVAGAQYVPANSMFIAFNKAIASELSDRLPNHVKASTFHALGLGFLRQRLPKGMKVDAYKVLRLLDSYPRDLKESKRNIARLVGIGKNLGINLVMEDTLEEWEAIMENHDLTPIGDNPEEVDKELFLEAARETFALTTKDISVIDFDDMLYLTLHFIQKHGWKPPQIPCIIIDEVQDTNLLQMHILRHFTSRVIGVGDAYQAIYGFRGAGIDSMINFQNFFKTENYPLSYTFRCASKVVKEAQSLNPAIKARPNAPEGIVTESRIVDQVYDYCGGTDLIICRNNAPLIGVALKLLKQKRPFRMSGKYPAQLEAFVKRFKAQHIQMFRVRLKDWWDSVREELTEKQKWGALQREEDKFESLWALQSESTDMTDLFSKLRYMMNNTTGIHIASIHASKGLEADNVHFLYPEFIPSKYAIKDWQVQQEDNLYYVGVTRAKSELHFYYGKK